MAAGHRLLLGLRIDIVVVVVGNIIDEHRRKVFAELIVGLLGGALLVRRRLGAECETFLGHRVLEWSVGLADRVPDELCKWTSSGQQQQLMKVSRDDQLIGSSRWWWDVCDAGRSVECSRSSKFRSLTTVGLHFTGISMSSLMWRVLYAYMFVFYILVRFNNTFKM